MSQMFEKKVDLSQLPGCRVHLDYKAPMVLKDLWEDW